MNKLNIEVVPFEVEVNIEPVVLAFKSSEKNASRVLVGDIITIKGVKHEITKSETIDGITNFEAIEVK